MHEESETIKFGDDVGGRWEKPLLHLFDNTLFIPPIFPRGSRTDKMRKEKESEDRRVARLLDM